MIVCIVISWQSQVFTAWETGPENQTAAAPILFMFFSVQNLAIIRKLMFFQAVVRGSFINKISQIGEN